MENRLKQIFLPACQVLGGRYEHLYGEFRAVCYFIEQTMRYINDMYFKSCDAKKENVILYRIYQ